MTQPTHEQIQAWAEAYLKGTISPAEKEALLHWYQDVSQPSLQWPDAAAGSSEELRLAMLLKVRQKAGLTDTPQPRYIRLVARYAIAASVLLAVIASYFWVRTHSQRQVIQIASIKDIAPGQSGAILTLANGSHIVLDSTRNGELALQGATRVVKQQDELNYHEKSGPETSNLLYNTVATPRGHQYKLVLPDGTRVWLNAASSISFPVAFSGDRREVSITGEAYFEVVRDAKRPFHVHSDGADIDVLGTCFDLMSYKDEGLIQATLLEGSIKVLRSEKARVLTPGQQAIVANEANGIAVQQADTALSVAWKNGLFQFQNDDIHTVMRQLSRWYDVDVQYIGTVSSHFIATIPRDLPVSQMFKILEQTGGAHFSIDGRKIIVQP
jgi:transmembrane sensor